MKHNLRIISYLILLFFTAQIVGLAITNQYIDHQATQETGSVTFASLPYNIERPIVEESTSYGYILAAILIGTILVLILMRFRKILIWKSWFFLSVVLVLTVSLAAFFPQNLAFVVAVLLAFWKIFRRNIIVHNIIIDYKCLINS